MYAIESCHNDLESSFSDNSFIHMLFNLNGRIFEHAPGALQMFSFSTGFDGVEENLYQSTAFKAHAGGVVLMLDQAVNML